MELMKICFKCGVSKELTEFYKHPAMADGHVNKCKECNKSDVRGNYSDNKAYYRQYDKTRQKTSRKRIFNHRYSQLLQRVDGRATRHYKVENTEVLTRAQYDRWLIENMDAFEQLYQQWEASGFKRGLTPSIDRVNNKLGYTSNNMRWLTVSENSKKYNKEDI